MSAITREAGMTSLRCTEDVQKIRLIGNYGSSALIRVFRVTGYNPQPNQDIRTLDLFDFG